jgi:16S rRNA (adenine(1408)-N(1))-methyltransferase
MESSVQLVQGRARQWLPAMELRRLAAVASSVLIDVGTGDGRLVYRLARRDPTGLFIGIDANAEALREVSHRASRKPARGGVANVLFVRMALEDLPGPLAGLADRVTVIYPWGSLLRALVEPDERALRGLARLGRPGGSFEARLNRSAVDPLALDFDALRAMYRIAGIELRWELVGGEDVQTTWEARLSPHDRQVLRLTGTIGQPGPGAPAPALPSRLT